MTHVSPPCGPAQGVGGRGAKEGVFLSSRNLAQVYAASSTTTTIIIVDDDTGSYYSLLAYYVPCSVLNPDLVLFCSD